MNPQKFLLSLIIYCDTQTSDYDFQSLINQLRSQCKEVNFEILICDDGILENKKNWINSIVFEFGDKCKYFKKNSPVGQNKFWNEAFKFIEGKYVLFGNISNKISDNCLKIVKEHISKDSDFDIVSFDATYKNLKILNSMRNLTFEGHKKLEILNKDNANTTNKNTFLHHFFSSYNLVFNANLLKNYKISFETKENYDLLFVLRAIIHSKNTKHISQPLMEIIFRQNYHSLSNLLSQWKNIFQIWNSEISKNKLTKEILDYYQGFFTLIFFPSICIISTNKNNALEYITFSRNNVPKNYYKNLFILKNVYLKNLLRKMSKFNEEKLYNFLLSKNHE